MNNLIINMGNVYTALIDTPDNNTVDYGIVTTGFNMYEARDTVGTIKDKHGDGVYKLKLCDRYHDENGDEKYHSPIATFDVKVLNGTIIYD